MAVLKDREANGITDEAGKEASPLPTNKSSVELGTENQTRLIGVPATGEYIAFAPAIDQFLKGHLFGDIFGRDNLDFQSRESPPSPPWPTWTASTPSWRPTSPSASTPG
jgi:hypothetical protein